MQFTLPNAHFLLHRSLMRFLCESDDFIVFELETFQFRPQQPLTFAKSVCFKAKINNSANRRKRQSLCVGEIVSGEMLFLFE